MNNTARPRSTRTYQPLLVAMFVTSVFTGLSAQVQAQTSSQVESSWFEIELLAFSREPQQQLLEQFPDKAKLVAPATALDLLSRHYQPDIRPLLLALPACQGTVDTSVLWAQKLQLTDEALPSVGWSMPQLNRLANTADQLAYGQVNSQSQIAAQGDIYTMPALPILCQYEQRNQHWQQPEVAVSVRYQNQPASTLQLPLTPPGEETHQNGPYLATSSALQLNDLAYQLQHRSGHQLLLHTVWRQTLASKHLSRSSRWYGGRNFGNQFDAMGRPAHQQPIADDAAALNQQIQQLEQQLRQARKPDLALASLEGQADSASVWQLDGLLKIYSDRMLFAEAEFNFRRLSADGQQLQTFYSQEQTRLLIGEIHYLDHPYLGLVLQIRRFTPPQLPTTAVSP